jgi:hypothetical protein
MRSLAKPAVLLRSGYAAAFTTLACYPRVAIWLDRPYTTLSGCAVILWTTFVLWAFVFAWQPEYARRPVVTFAFSGRIWAWAAGYGVTAAIMLHFFLDPQLRLTTPKDYPADWHAWIAMCLFALALDPLFLCFAPYAFFIRLSRRPDVSFALTVMFGIFVQFLKINASRPQPPMLLVFELTTVHVIGGFVSVYLYLRGGVLPVWLTVFILQLRHCYDLLSHQ